MPVSIGDVISISLIVKDLVQCLDKSRGSSAEYQAVIHELRSLDRALLEVGLLLRSCEQSVELSSIRESAMSCAEQCRKCVVDFQKKIKSYHGALNGESTDGRYFIRDTTAKIRWHVSEKDELAKFRAEITTHCSSMNLLLITAGIKLSMLNHEADLAQTSALGTQASLLADINTRCEETNALIQAAASDVKLLNSRIDFNYFRRLGAQLLSFVHNIWRINSKTYHAVVALQNRIPPQLDRTWTQDPVIFEDALGREARFHSEFLESWEIFEAVLAMRFQQLPGHRKIKQKEYVLRSSLTNRDVDTSIAFSRCFLPGQRYDMSMVFDAPRAQNSCPACHLDTGEASDAPVKCNRCGTLYQRVVEALAEKTPVAEKTAVPSKRPFLKRQREVDFEDDDEPRHFRRVRLRCRQRAGTEHCEDEADFDVLPKSGQAIIWCICGAQETSARIAKTWLIQCAGCKVWQHRSCVGTANGNDPPRGYYCERCREAPITGGNRLTAVRIRCRPCSMAFTGSLENAKSNYQRHLRTSRRHYKDAGLKCPMPECRNRPPMRSDNLGPHLKKVHRMTWVDERRKLIGESRQEI